MAPRADTTTTPEQAQQQELRDQLAVAKAAPAKGKSLIDEVKELAPGVRIATSGTPIDADRFLRVALTELRTKPELLNCTRESVLGGLMLCAQLGLEPGGPLGHAYLVPFKNRKTGRIEATFILGYKGIIALARRSGHIESIVARAVFEHDDFTYEFGLDEKLVHRPKLDGDRGQPFAYYAVARYVGGGHNFVVLSKSDVDRYRARSRAKDSGPWITDYEAMALKTCVRRLAAWLPLTVEAATAVDADESVARGIDVDASELASLAEASRRELEAGDQADTPTEGEQETAPIDTTGTDQPPADADGQPTSQQEGDPA